MHDNVHLQLQHEVLTIDWSHHRVVVSGQFLGQPFQATARRAVITLPLGVLQAGDRAVRFHPALEQKQAALARLVAGAVIKIVMIFRAPFWQEMADGQYRNASFLHVPGARFPTFWTALPRQAPMLTAWVGGPRASKLSADSDFTGMIRQALESLDQLFGKGEAIRAQLVSAYLHDWQRDRFALGAYSYVAVGGGNARQQLAASLEDTLFFAGEATHREAAATVSGALQSGERAADEIFAAG
jgi:monoamine oxidase